jgi:hypothetical protein
VVQFNMLNLCRDRPEIGSYDADAYDSSDEAE